MKWFGSMTQIVDQPRPGYFRAKLVKGGVWVGVRIWWEEAIDPLTGEVLDRPARLVALMDDEPIDPAIVWNRCCDQPISVADYEYLIEDSRHAKLYRPDDAKADPRKAVNMRTMPPVLPPGVR